MAHKLQEIAYQTPELIDFRKRIVNEMLTKVKELNRNNFSVRNHLEWVERYSDINSYTNITFEQTLNVQKELAFLIEPENDDAEALRFDSLLYGIEFANLCRTRNALSLRYLKKKAQALSKIANIPEINKHSELINKIIHTSFVENATFNDFEKIRKELRDLMKYIEPVEPRHSPCEIDFEEQVISTEWAVRENDEDQFVDYKAKARYFVLAHKDNPAIAKLNGNLPLNNEDVAELEKILWSELGTEDDYRKNFGQTNLGEFVRSIVGLDMKAAKEAFSEFLDETKLDSNQIYFVNQIVEYIVQNGMIKDMRVLLGAPFNAHGSFIDLFKDLTIWQRIVKVIQKVNDNAKVEA